MKLFSPKRFPKKRLLALPEKTPLLIRNLPRKPTASPKKPITIVFTCLAGKATSRVFAEALEKYLEMNNEKKLKSCLNIQYAGPMNTNPNKEAIKRANYIYSTLPFKDLSLLYKKVQGFKMPVGAEKKCQEMASVTVLKVLDDVPTEQIAKRVSYFFDNIVRKIRQDYKIQA